MLELQASTVSQEKGKKSRDEQQLTTEYTDANFRPHITEASPKRRPTPADHDFIGTRHRSRFSITGV